MNNNNNNKGRASVAHTSSMSTSSDRVGYYKGKEVYRITINEYFDKREAKELNANAVYVLSDVRNLCVSGERIFGQLNNEGTQITGLPTISVFASCKEQYDTWKANVRAKEMRRVVTERPTVESMQRPTLEEAVKQSEQRVQDVIASGAAAKVLEESGLASEILNEAAHPRKRAKRTKVRYSSTEA